MRVAKMRKCSAKIRSHLQKTLFAPAHASPPRHRIGLVLNSKSTTRLSSCQETVQMLRKYVSQKRSKYLPAPIRLCKRVNTSKTLVYKLTKAQSQIFLEKIVCVTRSVNCSPQTSKAKVLRRCLSTVCQITIIPQPNRLKNIQRNNIPARSNSSSSRVSNYQLCKNKKDSAENIFVHLFKSRIVSWIASNIKSALENKYSKSRRKSCRLQIY